MSVQVSQFTILNGEVLFRETQPARHFYLILSGKILVLDQSGRVIIRFYEADQMFGLPEVIAGVDWPYTTVAYGKTVIKSFSANIMYERMELMPQMHQHFLNQMARLSM